MFNTQVCEKRTCLVQFFPGWTKARLQFSSILFITVKHRQEYVFSTDVPSCTYVYQVSMFWTSTFSAHIIYLEGKSLQRYIYVPCKDTVTEIDYHERKKERHSSWCCSECAGQNIIPM